MYELLQLNIKPYQICFSCVVCNDMFYYIFHLLKLAFKILELEVQFSWLMCIVLYFQVIVVLTLIKKIFKNGIQMCCYEL